MTISNHKSDSKSNKVSAGAVTPWIGSPQNRVAVRVTEAGAIEIAGEMEIPPHATQHVVIDYLHGFENRIRESLRGKPLLKIEDVASRLSVSKAWVRHHASDLGAVHLGNGRGNDLRFIPERVETFITRRIGR